MRGGFGVIACGLDVARAARRRDRRDRDADRPALRRQPHHPASRSSMQLIDVCLAAQGRPCRARRRPAARRRHPADQGRRRQGDLLRPGAGAGQEAGAHRRRCDHHRGHGGGRPYRPGLDQRAGAGDPAADPRRAGLRRRRHRPRRGDRWPIWRWARPACSSARASSAPPNRSPIRSFKQAFIRAAARDAVPSVQLDPRFPGDPGARARQCGDQALPRDAARGHRPVRPRRARPEGGAARDRAFLGRRAAPRGDRRRCRERLADGRARASAW